MNIVRIATRQSRLALWQAEEVARQLRMRYPGLECELVKISTKGDLFLDAPLGTIGGKGLFVKELEQAMLEGRADIAVHSMKDVTIDLPDGLHLPVIMARANPLDAVVSPQGDGLDSLPAGTRIGSSSLRRQCQIRARRPDLKVLFVRGNVDTRLAKLDAGDFDVLMLACAGLERLGLHARITESVSADVIVPAVGQGAMGIECRLGDDIIETKIAALNHRPTAAAVRAERALNRGLGGGCHLPVAGFAVLEGETLKLHGLVGSVDGQLVLEHRGEGDVEQPEALGEAVAQALIDAGAERILTAVNG